MQITSLNRCVYNISKSTSLGLSGMQEERSEHVSLHAVVLEQFLKRPVLLSG